MILYCPWDFSAENWGLSLVQIPCSILLKPEGCVCFCTCLLSKTDKIFIHSNEDRIVRDWCYRDKCWRPSRYLTKGENTYRVSRAASRLWENKYLCEVPIYINNLSPKFMIPRKKHCPIRLPSWKQTWTNGPRWPISVSPRAPQASSLPQLQDIKVEGWALKGRNRHPGPIRRTLPCYLVSSTRGA